MKTFINIVLAIFNIGCIIIGSFCDTCWSSLVVCTISTILFIFNTIVSEKMNSKVERHDKALTISGNDVEQTV